MFSSQIFYEAIIYAIIYALIIIIIIIKCASLFFQIQGGIIVASLVQIFIGCTGILGMLLQYIGPITIVPTITLVGLSLIDVALRFCEKHWGISAL